MAWASLLGLLMLGACDRTKPVTAPARSDACRLVAQWSISRTDLDGPGDASQLDVHGVQVLRQPPLVWVLWSEPAGLYLAQRDEAQLERASRSASETQPQGTKLLGPACPRGFDTSRVDGAKGTVAVVCGRAQGRQGELWATELELPRAMQGAPPAWSKVAPLGRDGGGVDLPETSPSRGGSVAFQQGEVGDYRAVRASYRVPSGEAQQGTTDTPQRHAATSASHGAGALRAATAVARLSREGPSAWAPTFVQNAKGSDRLVWHEQAYDEAGVVGEILIGTAEAEPELVSTTLAAIAHPRATQFNGATWVTFVDQNPSGSKDRLFLQMHQPGFRLRKGSGARHPTLRGIGRVYAGGDMQPLVCGPRLFPIHTRHYSPDEVYAAIPVYVAAPHDASRLARAQDEIQLYRASAIAHRVHGACTPDGLLLATGARVKTGIRIDLLQVQCPGPGEVK